jgi:hypothetical protein
MIDKGSVLDQREGSWIVMEPDEIGDDEWVSQRVYIEDGQPVVRNRPRPKDRGRLSAIRGKVTPADALRVVRSSFRKTPASAKDGVRHARVSDLRQAGFVVQHTPNRRNPDHVSIVYSSRWDRQVAEKLHRCFSEILWHDEEGGEQSDAYST